MFGDICLASKRVALVIGNSRYAAAPLENPVNDAQDMADLLGKLGFDVIKKINVTKKQMITAASSFSRKLSKSEIGLFYYAGYGMQINGRNFLIPVDVNVEVETDVEFEAVDASRIIARMKMANNDLNVVILDACRNNPFARSFRSASQGLARMDAPRGTIIAYATGPGAVAADGRGRNGIFTKHLLAAMKKPTLDLHGVFNEAGMAVMRETSNKQVPWTSNTPLPQYFLAGTVLVEERHKDQTTGSLEVLSNPLGGKVSINGIKRGVTPLTLDSLKSGSMNVSVSMEGYVSEGRQVIIKPGGKLSVSVALSLEEIFGWLTVSTEPYGAKVRILNSSSSYKPGVELDAGRYHIEVSKEGYKTIERLVDIEQRAKLDVTVVLQKEELGGAVPSATLVTTMPYGKEYTDTTTGMEFVYVPGGCYQMGDTFGDGDGDERPVHEVCVDSFYLGKYEVTQGEYQEIAGKNPSEFGGWLWKDERYPVENVSWADAQSFIRTLNQRSDKNYRLPTEAEWEYAARSGGKKERYSGSNALDAVAWHGGNSERSTHSVGTQQANSLGLYDMSGNVLEWCQDWYDKSYYQKSPRQNPLGPLSGSYRVNRGGSWTSIPRIVRGFSCALDDRFHSEIPCCYFFFPFLPPP